MGDGVLIRPRLDRGPIPVDALIVVRDLSRPIPPPRDGSRLIDALPACSLCTPPDRLERIRRGGLPPSEGVQHTHKTYHVVLHDGVGIVSEGVWDRLRGMVDCGGFELVGHTSTPPPQTMTLAPAIVKPLPGTPGPSNIPVNGHRPRQ